MSISHASTALLAAVTAPALAAGPVQYAYDDGSGGTTIGPVGFAATMTWGNYFYADPDAGPLCSIEVSFASGLGAGRDLTLIVFEDPDDDGNPFNAVPILVTQALTMQTGPQDFASYPIPRTRVSGGFMVAVAVAVADRESAARGDSTRPPGAPLPGQNSWLFYDGMPTTDPSEAPFALRMADGPFPAHWMLRASALPAPGPAAALLAGAALLTRRRRA